MQIRIDSVSGLRPQLAELEALHSLLTTGKTTAAAHQLGVSQPAISRAIASLEAKTGEALFTRSGGRLKPTALAFALDADAAPIFATLTRLRGWPNRGQVGDALKVMAPPTLAHVMLAPLVAGFCRDNPQCHVSVEVGRSSDVINSVADQSADLGIVDVEISHAGIRSHVLRRNAAEVLLPVDHPLAALTVINPHDLADQSIVAVTKRFSARANLERAFRHAEVDLKVSIEAGTLEFVMEMVRQGLGVAVVNPFPTALFCGNDMVLRPFYPAIVHEISLLTPIGAPLRPALQKFSDLLDQHNHAAASETMLAQERKSAQALGRKR